MVDQDSRLLAEMDRARQAQELMEHPLLREALDGYKARLTQEWADSPARDTDGRERLWLMQKTVGMVECHMLELMETGKLASVQMEQRRNLLQRAADSLWS